MAVYTNVSDPSLRAFLRNYAIGALVRKTPIAEGVENTNYQIETDTGQYILTLFEKRTREEDLPFFMAFTDQLARQGLPVPAPIKSRDGEIIKRLSDRPAVIVEFLNGRPRMVPSANDCKELGQVLATLHNKAGGFDLNRKNPLSLPGWLSLAKTCGDEADRCAPGLAAAIRDECKFLSDHWPVDLPSGIVHSDLFPDNVLFEDDKISGVIDFYFSCTDFFAYDLAVCINAWCFRNEQLQKGHGQDLLQQYQLVRALSAAEIAALPVLLRGAALRFLLTRLFDWLNQVEGALVKVKDPLEYYQLLQFHQNQSTPSLYGL